MSNGYCVTMSLVCHLGLVTLGSLDWTVLGSSVLLCYSQLLQGVLPGCTPVQKVCCVQSVLYSYNWSDQSNNMASPCPRPLIWLWCRSQLGGATILALETRDTLHNSAVVRK